MAETKPILVAIKSYARSDSFSLDNSEIWESLSEAQNYAQNPIAYGGQTIKALVDGKYKQYILQPTESGGLTLEDLSTQVSQKEYVKIVSEFPSSDQIQGIIYINSQTLEGKIWLGTEWKTIFKDVQFELDEIQNQIDEKAPINNPTFTGKVTLAADPTEDLEAATKQYVDNLINRLTTFAPDIVDSDNPLPDTYKVGQSFRVAEAGTYAGNVCEVGDLIIVLKDYNEDSASNSDFMVVQANIDGAVTGIGTSTAANIVIFDDATGKKIKDSNVSLTSLQDAIAKSHTHDNKTILDTYNKSQSDLLSEIQENINDAVGTINESLNTKANASDVYNRTEIDSKLQTITTNLNSKVSAEEVNSAISNRIGDIPESTSVKEYVDSAIGAGGTDVSDAIATAKQEAIDASNEYADGLFSELEKLHEVVEF